MKNCVILLMLFYFINASCYSQDNTSYKGTYKKAIHFFEENDYPIALKNFKILDSIKPNDFEINYYVGACYLNSKYDRIKALPYLEFAIREGDKYLPEIVYRDLGLLYHELYRFDEAIVNFNKYFSLADPQDDYNAELLRTIEYCNNALEITRDSSYQDIMNIGSPINTEISEYSPLITADGSLLYYTSSIYSDDKLSTQGRRIFVAEKVDGQWSNPTTLTYNSKKNENYSLAGISPDGGLLFVEFEGDIFSCSLNGKYADKPIKLYKTVNTEFRESFMSITPDRQYLYFSSNRPGGYGGHDLYRSKLQEDGSWGYAENLGIEINTQYNEEAPFIHSDCKTLYFSSKGHNSIGGYDIFMSVIEDNNWSVPVNIGYPINTTKDDLNFSVSACGSSGFFASSTASNLSHYDIYEVDLKTSIPLTLVKGTILAGSTLQPVKAKIRVIDKESGEQIKYIYNPNQKSGKYLMIFPPARNYEMIVEAEGYLPHMVQIYVPDQTYYYELFQEIHLRPIRTLGEIVGEEIKVTNTFYDINIALKDDSKAPQLNNYNNLEQMIEKIITTSDQLGIERIDQLTHSDSVENIEKMEKEAFIYKSLMETIEFLIENTDTLLLDSLNKNTLYSDKASQVYFYNVDKNHNDLQRLIVGNDTLDVTPTLKVDYHLAAITPDTKNKLNFNIKQNSQISESNTASNTQSKKTILKFDLFFETAEYELNEQQENSLREIAQLLLSNRGLIMDISGFCDNRGATGYNDTLSLNRAKSVTDFLVMLGVDPERAVLNAFGERYAGLEQTTAKINYDRRVEVYVKELGQNVKEGDFDLTFLEK